MVDQSLGRASNHGPGVIGAVEKERPGPKRDRGSDRPASQGRRHGRRVALRRFEHRPPKRATWSKKAGPAMPPSSILATDASVASANGKCVVVPGAPRGYVNVDEHRDLGSRHVLASSSPDGRVAGLLEPLVLQEVGRQLVALDIGLRYPGNRQVEAALGDPRRLGV